MRTVLVKKKTVKNSNREGLDDSLNLLNDDRGGALVTLLGEDQRNDQTVESKGLSEN